MTPSEQGRHCTHCSKTVIDFTAWSDTALYAFFTKKQEHVCGRFLSTQLNRPIHIPPQPHGRLYRMVIAMGLVLIFVQGTDAYAQARAPLIEQPTTTETLPKRNADTTCQGFIKGVVLDEKKVPIIGATVSLSKGSSVVAEVITDLEGAYFFGALKGGKYILHVRYLGYSPVTVKGLKIHSVKLEGITRDIELTPSILGMFETMIHEYHPDPPGTHTFKRQDINRMPIR